MRKFHEYGFIRRSLSCLLIISMILTGFSIPTPRLALGAELQNHILSFSVDGQKGASVINTTEGNHEVTFFISNTVNTKLLTPNITVSAGASLELASELDFSKPVYYTVTSAEGVAQTWLVMCYLLSVDTDIREFFISEMEGEPEYSVSINANTIEFTVPEDTDVTSLTPNFSIFSGATVDPEPDPDTTQDFSNPEGVTYTVTAEAGNTQIWTIICRPLSSQRTYYVDHYLQSLDGTGYAEPAPTNYTAIKGTFVTATPQNYPGFTLVDGHEDEVATGTVPDVGTLRLKLYYDRNVYSIQFEENGGSSVSDITGIRYEALSGVLPEPSKNDYVFQGWYRDAELTNRFYSNTEVTGNLTLYAKWKYDYSDVSYRLPNGNLLLTQNFKNGTVFTQPSDPVIGGYTLMGWYLEPTLTTLYGFDQPLTNNLNLYGMYKRSDNDIHAFNVPGQFGVSDIDYNNHTIHFYLQQGSSAAALTPTISVSEGAEIFPNSGEVGDFSQIVTYQVTAEDGTPQAWTVSHSIYYEVINTYIPAPTPLPEEEEPEDEKEELEEAVEEEKVKIVQVNTGGASVTGPNSAVLTGTLVAGGGSQIQTGFRYREEAKDQWLYTPVKSSNLTDGQSFSYEIKGLKPDTAYVFAARASNSMGLSNGGGSSFTTEKAEKPTVITNTATAGELGSMLLTGAVTKEGGDIILDAGFLWGESPISLQQLSLGTEKNLSGELKDLVIGKTYYYQAYATNSAGTGTGNLLTYILPGLAVTTLEAIEIKEKSATLQGSIAGKDKIIECGFTISPGKQGKVIAKADEKGYFKIQIDNLIPNKVYYFTAYAKTNNKTYYGKSRRLTLLDSVPIVETAEKVEVGQIWAQFAGTIKKIESEEEKGDGTNNDDSKINNSLEDTEEDTNDKDEDPILECGFYWGDTPDTTMQIIMEGDGEIYDPAHKLVGLQAGTTYYYKAYAINKKGTGYGETVSFTTAAPTIPDVNTRFAGYNSKSRQWIMKGSVVNKGGVPLSEYGFLISGDQVGWTELAVGFDVSGNFIAKDLPFISQLKPGTYYVKAYALNIAGKGEGGTIPFVIPTLPAVAADIDKTASEVGTCFLKGRITDTGAEGAQCQTTRFTYRKKGDTDWITVGESHGYFNASEFTYKLTGLIPGVIYEFKAEAVNITGYSSSQIIEFIADYGKDGVQVAEYLKQNGTKPQEIANILREKFAYTLEATAQLLMQCGYTGTEMGAALKASTYKPTFKNAAQIFKKLGFSAMLTAQILYDHYEDMRRTGYAADWSLMKILKENQFGFEDSVKALTTLYRYDIAGLTTLLTTGTLYTRKEAYSAALIVFGQEPLIKYIWTVQTSGGGFSMSQILSEFLVYLRDVCGLSQGAVADKLLEYYPQLSLELAAELFANNRYPVGQTISVLGQRYGAADLELVRVVNKKTSKSEDIIKYLIEEMDYTPVQIVTVITNAITGWKDAKEGCTLVLKNYYGMGAIEAAKVMYAAGWTEALDGKGYGLGQLLTAMSMYYGKKSYYDQMEILKALDQSPLAISLRVGGTAGWLKDYKALGFTATDAALYYREEPGWKRYSLRSQVGALVRHSDEAGYELKDIALALRTVFSLDMATAFNYIKDNTKKDTKLINAALETAYGGNPLMDALYAMSGNSIKQIVKTLRSTYNISSPEEATEYLKKAGYLPKTILEGISGTYFSNKNLAEFQAFLEYSKKALPECSFTDALNAVVLQYGNNPEPKYIISTMKRLGYDMKEMAVIFYKEYRLPLHDALDAMLYLYGRAKETEYTKVTIAAYNADIGSYVEYEKMRGTDAIKCTEQLVKDFDVKEASKAAGLLAKGGYGKEEVSGALLKVFYNDSLSSEVLTQIDNILNLNYPDTGDNKTRKLLKDGQIKPVSKAIAVLVQAGYSLEEILKALKEVYALSDAQIIDELNALDQFTSDEISVTAQGALGNNFLTMQVRQLKAEPWGSADFIYHELRDRLGIKDPAIIFRYLRYAGFSELETVNTVYSLLWDDIIPVMKTVYDVKNTQDMGKLLGRFNKEQLGNMPCDRFANHLISAFPGTTSYDVVRALQAFGSRVTGTDSIETWLRFNSGDGKHDDKLAAILGKNNDGIGLPARFSTEILKNKGYVIQDTVFWLLECGYTWEEFYAELVHNYAPEKFPVSYYENNSSSKFIVRDLKDYYSIYDIIHGEIAYLRSVLGVLPDLVSGGYTTEQSVYALLWLDKVNVSDLLVGIVDNSIIRAIADNKPSQRLNAISAASMMFDISLAVAYDKQTAGLTDYKVITLEDIAACLVKYGPSNGRDKFSDWEVLAAMQAVAEKYIGLTQIGLPSRELALATLRVAGASPSDAAAMLAAHGVGLSTASIIKSIFGIGDDWINAVKAMAGAGYSYSDSISAVYNNSSYKTMIGIGMLGNITTWGVKKLSTIANLGAYIKIVQEVAKVGFKIGDGTITMDDVLKYNINYLQYKYGKKIYNYIPKDYVPLP